MSTFRNDRWSTRFNSTPDLIEMSSLKFDLDRSRMSRQLAGTDDLLFPWAVDHDVDRNRRSELPPRHRCKLKLGSVF